VPEHGKQTSLQEAFRALAVLVHDEYDDRYTLGYIASTWGEGITPEQLDALRFWAHELLGEPLDEFVHERG
jgi:hypothetical protein